MLLHFDYDGVIADSMPQLLSLTRRAQQAVGFGRPPSTQDYATIEYLTFENHARCLGIPEARVQNFVSTIFDLQGAELWDVPVYPGIQPVLTALSLQHQIAIVTSSLTRVVWRSLSLQGLDSAVSAVFGGELGLSKAERIARSCAKRGIDPARTFMVGDTVGDIQQGRLAGARTVAVAWGFHPRLMLLSAAPDFIADQPQDLLTILSAHL